MGNSAPPARPAGPDDVSGFYDIIADDYHLTVHQHDWRQVMEDQGRRLEAVMATRLETAAPWKVLDCSCGIGTQAIGLALRGHHVVGTDLSPRAVDRARGEAALLGVPATFAVADMCRLHLDVEGEFDAVISCGNSFAHLGPNEVAVATRAMSAKVTSGGIALVSIRDYDALAESRPRVPSLPQVHDTPGGRRVTFQLWDWEPDASAYSMTWIFLREGDTGLSASEVTTRLHAHRRSDLTSVFENLGFVAPKWHLPPAGTGFDPILTALRP